MLISISVVVAQLHASVQCTHTHMYSFFVKNKNCLFLKKRNNCRSLKSQINCKCNQLEKTNKCACVAGWVYGYTEKSHRKKQL